MADAVDDETEFAGDLDMGTELLLLVALAMGRDGSDAAVMDLSSCIVFPHAEVVTMEPHALPSASAQRSHRRPAAVS